MLIDENDNDIIEEDKLHKVRPIINVTINNYSLQMFLDTGAPANILDKRTYDEYFSEFPLRSDSGKQLNAIEGSPLKVIGRTKLKVELEKD